MADSTQNVTVASYNVHRAIDASSVKLFPSNLDNKGDLSDSGAIPEAAPVKSLAL